MVAPAAPRQPSESEIQEALAVGEMVRAQITQVEEQRAYVTELMGEFASSRAALEALKSAQAGDEVLLPLGGGTFVRAHMAETGRAITSLGSGIHAETSLEKAIERVGERIQNLERASERLTEEATRLAGEMSRVNALLQEMAGR